MQALSKNGAEQTVRRILSSRKELAAFNLDSIPSVSSVLRGAEGPSQNKQFAKKIMKKSVVISKPSNQAGLQSVS